MFTAAAETVAELMKDPALYKPSVYGSMSLAFDEENLLAAEWLMIDIHNQLSSLAKQRKHPTSVTFIGNFFLTVVRLKKES